MPDTGFLFLSLASVVVGMSLFLFPVVLTRVSEWLNRTFIALDERLMHYRYLLGFLAFVASYAFFKIALLLPSLRG